MTMPCLVGASHLQQLPRRESSRIRNEAPRCGRQLFELFQCPQGHFAQKSMEKKTFQQGQTCSDIVAGSACFNWK